MLKYVFKKDVVKCLLWFIIFFFIDNGEEVWGGGEEEGYEDYYGVWLEGDGLVGDVGEGGGFGFLRY